MRPTRSRRWRVRSCLQAALVLLLAQAASAAVSATPPAFGRLEGWAADDHEAAVRSFVAGCRSRTPIARPLAGACRAASAVPAATGAARGFFERWFDPVEVSSRGFLTGYYEPELGGSREPDGRFRTPLLARPADLVPLPASGPPPGWPPGLTAARRTASGYEPMPDRAAIERGALGEAAPPVVHLADPVDAFIVHVQGSARIRLPDGRAIRVGFDGRNGHPYTAVARILADREGVARSGMTADRLAAWLRAHPDQAPDIMRANRSYIFVRETEDDASAGPVGAAGVPLTAGRSLAVDPSAWPYGIPVWLEGELPRPEGGRETLRRLVLAQDTSAAIVGPARGDLFFGSGDEAGLRAGLTRQPVRWVVFRPRQRPRLGTAGP